MAAPEFRSGPPARLTSWSQKGPNWGSANEVKMMQKRDASVMETGAKLTSLV